MSLILAVRDDRDIVLASDGRVLDGDLAVISDRSLKTLALNDALCLGLAGPTETMRVVLSSLGTHSRGVHPVDLLAACQQTACPVDVDYHDARDEVTSVLRWIARRASARLRQPARPAAVLAGREENRPALCHWRYPAQPVEVAGGIGYSEAIVGSVPEAGTGAEAEFRRVVHGERSTARAEERLARAVRFCGRFFGALGPIGGTIFSRRLSCGFDLVRESAPDGGP